MVKLCMASTTESQVHSGIGLPNKCANVKLITKLIGIYPGA